MEVEENVKHWCLIVPSGIYTLVTDPDWISYDAYEKLMHHLTTDDLEYIEWFEAVNEVSFMDFFAMCRTQGELRSHESA